MGRDGHRKRHRAEKKAQKILKKLRKNAEKTIDKTENEAVEPPRRVYGPARPPESNPPKPTAIGPELPDFLKNRIQEEEEEDPVVEDQPVVGPELPENWKEESFEREGQSNDGEVERIIAVLSQERSFVDPYAILGLDPSSANDASVKKAYWKCSLAVHPDKSTHPSAQKAFQALHEAWKEVKDATSRQRVEEKKREATAKREAEAEAKKELRQRAWDHVRHSDGTKRVQEVQGRQEWMTELPQLRRMPRVMKQAHQTSFSRKEYTDVTSGASKSWMQKPEQRSEDPIGPSLCASASPPRPKTARKGVSLMEQHQAKITQQQRSASTSKKKQQGTPSFQYRPFDRERDLEGKGYSGSALGSMMKGLGSLGDRFR